MYKPKSKNAGIPCALMVGQVGIEPTTVGLKGRRSAPELLTHVTLIQEYIFCKEIFFPKWFDG